MSNGLKKALKLIENGWTQNTFARNKWGNHVSHSSPTAIRFCAIGAMWRAECTAEEWDIMWDLCNKKHNTMISVFNDNKNTKKEDVVSLFKEGVKLTKKK